MFQALFRAVVWKGGGCGARNRNDCSSGGGGRAHFLQLFSRYKRGQLSAVQAIPYTVYREPAAARCARANTTSHSSARARVLYRRRWRRRSRVISSGSSGGGGGGGGYAANGGNESVPDRTGRQSLTRSSKGIARRQDPSADFFFFYSLLSTRFFPLLSYLILYPRIRPLYCSADDRLQTGIGPDAVFFPRLRAHTYIIILCVYGTRLHRPGAPCTSLPLRRRVSYGVGWRAGGRRRRRV